MCVIQFSIVNQFFAFSSYHKNLKVGDLGFAMKKVPEKGEAVFACFSADLKWYRARVRNVYEYVEGM